MFGNGKTKDENRQEVTEDYAKKYGIESLTENSVIQDLAVKLSQADLLNLTAALSGNQPDRTKITYLSALTEQNWLIINQLNRLNVNIEKLLSK